MISHESEAPSFEKFLERFRLKYTSHELALRKAIFLQNVKEVIAHNRKSGTTYKKGINKFSAMTSTEKKKMMGFDKKKKQHQQLKHAKPFDLITKNEAQLPMGKDWRNYGVVGPVKDQGHCGSCWAFAATGVLESHVAIASGLIFDLSPQQFASCAPNPNHCGGTGGCEGGTAELAYDYLAGQGDDGMRQEYQYPYNSYYGEDYQCNVQDDAVAKITGFVQLPANNQSALMNAINTVGPLAISVDASTWHNYEGGVYDGCNQENPDIDHAVMLVGYGVDKEHGPYWLVRNSWSPAWGEGGYIRLKRTPFVEGDKCGMDTTPQDGSACDGQTDPVKVCGTCGILYDTSYPVGAEALGVDNSGRHP
jgi:cathepsin L